MTDTDVCTVLWLPLLSICLFVCAGLEEKFSISSKEGRRTNYEFTVVQKSGEVPIGIYDYRRSEVVLYEVEQYLWPDGSTAVPDELPPCYQETCLFISTYVVLALFLPANN